MGSRIIAPKKASLVKKNKVTKVRFLLGFSEHTVLAALLKLLWSHTQNDLLCCTRNLHLASRPGRNKHWASVRGIWSWLLLGRRRSRRKETNLELEVGQKESQGNNFAIRGNIWSSYTCEGSISVANWPRMMWCGNSENWRWALSVTGIFFGSRTSVNLSL